MPRIPDRRLDPPDECRLCGADTYQSDGLCSACVRELVRSDGCEEREDRERDFDDSRFAPED